MRGRSFCLAILLLCLPFAGTPGARADVTSKGLHFDLYRGYLIVARGSGGSGPDLDFLVDTGGNPTVLDRRVAQKLLLPEEPGVLAGINGRVQAGLTTVPSLQIGPIKRDNFR